MRVKSLMGHLHSLGCYYIRKDSKFVSCILTLTPFHPPNDPFSSSFRLSFVFSVDNPNFTGLVCLKVVNIESTSTIHTRNYSLKQLMKTML